MREIPTIKAIIKSENLSSLFFTIKDKAKYSEKAQVLWPEGKLLYK